MIQNYPLDNSSFQQLGKAHDACKPLLEFLVLPVEPLNVTAIIANVTIPARVYPVQIKQGHDAGIELCFAMPEFLATAYWAIQPVSCTLLFRGFLLL